MVVQKRLLCLALAGALLFCAGCMPIPGDSAASTATGMPSETTTETIPSEEPNTPSVPEETIPPETDPTEPAETIPPETIPPETIPPETVPPETVPPEPPKPESISAWIKGDYTVGDTIPDSAFTVRIKMSDGSTLSNPEGWKASTKTVSSTKTKVTVSYGKLKTTVTVEADIGPINGMELIKTALPHIGTPYVLGGNSLVTGVDCSGFTRIIFGKFGIYLPRTAAVQSTWGKSISLDEAKPGDLLAVKYEDNSTYTGHAAIYLGDGYMIHANPGVGVAVSAVGNMKVRRLYENTYSGSDEEAFQEALGYYASLGFTGSLSRGHLYVKDGTKRMFGTNPFYKEPYPYMGLSIDLSNYPEEYEPIVAAWKETAIKGGDSACYIYAEEGEESWAYWQGQWYSPEAMDTLFNAGQVTAQELSKACRFRGAFWEPDATLTNANGESVSLSTFPELSE